MNFSTSIGSNGHLSWNWMNYKGTDNIWLFIYLLFYIIPSIFINTELLYILVATLLFSLFFYFKYNTFGTMWCWISNIIFLYYIVNILLIQPYLEYNSLCY